eukprot:6465368-Prymnesium_polylepis.1
MAVALVFFLAATAGAISTGGPSGALALPDSTPLDADSTCNDSLPLANVWSEYFSGCEPGSAVAHIHTQAPQGISTPTAWTEHLPTHFISDPTLGEMRFNVLFVDAMVKLWESGLGHRAPNGCVPRR